jgi:hypothetical protein
LEELAKRRFHGGANLLGSWRRDFFHKAQDFVRDVQGFRNSGLRGSLEELRSPGLLEGLLEVSSPFELGFNTPRDGFFLLSFIVLVCVIAVAVSDCFACLFFVVARCLFSGSFFVFL